MGYCCKDEAGREDCTRRNIIIVDEDEPMITMTKVNLDNVPGTPASTHTDLTLEATKKGDQHMEGAGHPTQYQDAGATCSDFHDTDFAKDDNMYKHTRSWNHAGSEDGSQLSVVTEFRFRKLDETEFSGSWQRADNVHVEDYIDLTKIGVNEVRYSCTDLAGNAAQQMTRTITVVDTRCPFVTINGPPLTYVEAGFDYVDQGATATDSLDGMTIARHGIESSENEHTSDSELNSVHAEAGLYVLSYAAHDAAENCNDVAQCPSAACAKSDAKFVEACAVLAQKDANERAAKKAELRGLGCGNVVAETKRTVVVKDTLPPVIYLKLPNNYLNSKQVNHIKQYGVRGIGNGSGMQQAQAQVNEAAETAQKLVFEQVPYTVQPNNFPRRLMAEVAGSQTNTAGAVLGMAAAVALLAIAKRNQRHISVPV